MFSKQLVVRSDQWPVLDVHFLPLPFAALTQWRPEPNGFIGNERSHKAERLTWKGGNAHTERERPLQSGESGDRVNIQHHGQRHWDVEALPLCFDALSFCCGLTKFNVCFVFWPWHCSGAVCASGTSPSDCNWTK